MRALTTTAVLVGVALFFGATTEARVTIPAGLDLLETDPGATYQDLTIPPGSLLPFCDAGIGPAQRVFFKGVPFDCFRGTCGLHPTDTIIERLGSNDPSPPFDPVPIEIVALSLTSVSPITVHCTGGDQLWKLNVNLPAGFDQTNGDMTITHAAGTDGGTFTSFLSVRVALTFVRVSDGATVGPMMAPDPIEFCVGDARCSGTAGPAGKWSHVGGTLDDPAGDLVVTFVDTANFFPGVTCPNCPGGGGQVKKVLTEEEALQAKHGIKVAEKKHHYKCFEITGPALGLPVNLVDEFGVQNNVVVGAPKYICPPALKNGGGDLEIPHLKCYDILGANPPAVVSLSTQFGLERYVPVDQAKMLCVPALKEVVSPFQEPAPPGPPPLTPHYTCYSIAGPALVNVFVDIQTQFGLEPQEQVFDPVYKCVPSIKNGEGDLKQPDLKCYNILGDDPPHVVNLETQFGLEVNRAVGQAKLLCIPAKELTVVHTPAVTNWGVAALTVLMAGLAALFLARWIRMRPAR